MSRLQELHPDQEAVLQLVLRRRMAYADLAGALGLQPEQVRERALDAVDGLAPDDVAGLELGDRDRIADLLLGQGPDWERRVTRELLRTHPAAHAWASTVAAELAPLGGPREPVPTTAPGSDAPAPDAPQSDAPQSDAPGSDAPQPGAPASDEPQPTAAAPDAPVPAATESPTSGTAASAGAPGGVAPLDGSDERPDAPVDGSGTTGASTAAAPGDGLAPGPGGDEPAGDAPAGVPVVPAGGGSGDVRDAFAALDAERPAPDDGEHGDAHGRGRSRGLLGLAVVGLVVAALVVAWVGGVFDRGDGGGASAAAPTTSTTTSGAAQDAADAKAFLAALPKQINFNPPSGAQGAYAKVRGVAQSMLSQTTGSPVLALVTENMPKATSNRRYFAWADKQGEDPILLGQLTDARGAELPFTGADVATGQAVAVDPTVYNRIRITRSGPGKSAPRKPGPTVIVGTLTLRSAG